VDDIYINLEQSLGHVFSNKKYLATALTHRSAGQDNNERLEYLGDALLGFIIAETLYLQYPAASEGELTRVRATLVKGDTLVSLAHKLNLGDYLKLGSGEMKSGGWHRKSILSNTAEAIIGAVYLDAGLQTCRKIVLNLYHDLLQQVSPDKLIKDPKTRLQEYLQARQHELPVYKIVAEEGKAHNRTFTVQCVITDMDIKVKADGRSRRSAEQSAAQMVLDLLGT
jgi:ribonuclease III